MQELQNAGLTTLDIIVLAVLGFSGFIGLLRGFLREVATLFVIAAVFVLSGAATAPFSAYLDGMIGIKLVSLAVAGGVIALGGFIGFSLLAGAFVNAIRDKLGSLGGVDRALGMAFGLGRGALVVGIFYLISILLLGADNIPENVARSKTQPLLAGVSDMVKGLVPADLMEQLASSGKDSKDKDTATEEDKPWQAEEDDSAPTISTGFAEDAETYGDSYAVDAAPTVAKDSSGKPAKPTPAAEASISLNVNGVKIQVPVSMVGNLLSESIAKATEQAGAAKPATKSSAKPPEASPNTNTIDPAMINQLEKELGNVKDLEAFLKEKGIAMPATMTPPPVTDGYAPENRKELDTLIEKAN